MTLSAEPDPHCTPAPAVINERVYQVRENLLLAHRPLREADPYRRRLLALVADKRGVPKCAEDFQQLLRVQQSDRP